MFVINNPQNKGLICLGVVACGWAPLDFHDQFTLKRCVEVLQWALQTAEYQQRSFIDRKNNGKISTVTDLAFSFERSP